jgi:hypothetical protein
MVRPDGKSGLPNEQTGTNACKYAGNQRNLETEAARTDHVWQSAALE